MSRESGPGTLGYLAGLLLARGALLSRASADIALALTLKVQAAGTLSHLPFPSVAQTVHCRSVQDEL